MKFVCMADTHNQHVLFDVPEGDVFIHAGDFCGRGTLPEVSLFAQWLNSLPHKHKVVVAGNHDFPLQRESERAQAEALFGNVHYLRDASVNIDGIHIYGSPWTPWFHDWAFNLHRGKEIREQWQKIPGDVDVLITHGPMYGVGDKTFMGREVGCEDLLSEVVDRVRPRYHVCGHIHESRGTHSIDGITSLNVSCLDHSYRPTREPILTFELD